MPDPLQSPVSYYAPWEKKFGDILTPFEEFVHRETALGVILIFCTITALALANSPLAAAYDRLLHTHIAFSVGAFTVDHTLHHWINDGLMAFFFFVVGLEIKREVLEGDLSNFKVATLPIIAAAGGMLVPALIYAAFNKSLPTADGWGIPMATDIAFALGVLALLGDRVPKALFTFLVALAIVDDLGAVAVIAIFYTETIAIGALGLAGVCLSVLILFNLGGIRNPIPYFIVAVVLWFAMLESGIHATIAGVLGAMTVPIRPKVKPEHFSEHLRRLLDKFDALDEGSMTLLNSARQRAIVQAVESGVHKVESPLQRLEHSLHLPVAFLVVPVFALANAGVPIDFAGLGETLTQPVTLGIGLGLIVGKLIGVAGFTLIAAKLGLGQLPDGCRAAHIVGVALLAGIGFTMSIFIAELAFRNDPPEILLAAKTGILVASFIAGLLGYVVLRLAWRSRND
jgi:NhaA family Na+:H+ antiporter